MPSPHSGFRVVGVAVVIGFRVKLGVPFGDEVTGGGQAPAFIVARPKSRAHYGLGALKVDLPHRDQDHRAEGWRPPCASRPVQSASAVRTAWPLTRTTLADPGTMNIRLIRPSRTMLRKESMRLLPRQSRHGQSLRVHARDHGAVIPARAAIGAFWADRGQDAKPRRVDPFRIKWCDFSGEFTERPRNGRRVIDCLKRVDSLDLCSWRLRLPPCGQK